MSNVIDRRVVEMVFDNKRFESNVNTSLSTLDKLKRGLNLEGATKGLDNVAEAGAKVDMSHLSKALDNVSSGFSALEVMAVTSLVRITNAAIDAGKKIANAMIGPILDGGKRRALNIEQAKFQFEGLGMDVEATMADASYAVDGTAYSLDAAARVASQLGASGMRAGEEMRSALRAVSGVAAMAGSSYEDIGNVFTTVAGQGRIMGSDLLRLSTRGINAAATIADEFGLTEETIREMVSKGEVSFQMFSQAMDHAFGEHATAANKTFSGSLSNVGSALARIGEKFYTPFHRNLIDPLNALRVLVNEISSALDPAFDLLTKFMDASSPKIVDKIQGMDFEWLSPAILGSIDILKNVTSGISSVLTPIREAFREIFPPTSVNHILNFIDALKDFSSYLHLTDDASENLKRTFKGFFAIIDIFKSALSSLTILIEPVLGIFSILGDRILRVTGSLGDWAVALNDVIQEGDLFNRIMNTLIDVCERVYSAIQRAYEISKDTIIMLIEKINFPGFELLHSILERIQHRMSQIGEATANMRTGFSLVGDSINDSKFIQALEILWKGLKGIAGILAGLVGKTFGALFNAASNLDFKEFVDILNGLLTGGVLYGINNFLNTTERTINGIGIIRGRIIGILSGFRFTLETYQAKLKADVLMKIAAAIAVLTAAVVVLSLIDSVKLSAAIGAITVLFADLVATLSVFGKMGGGIKGVTKLSASLIAMSVSVLILSVALKKIGDIDNLTGSVAAITGLVTMLVIAAKILSKSGKTMMSGTTSLIAFATAIKILASALQTMGSMSGDEIGNGLMALAGSLIIVAGGLRAMPKDMAATGTGLIFVSTALVILAQAMKSFGSIEWDEVGRGLSTLAGSLTAITVALKLMPKNMISTGIGLIAVSTALVILAQAMKSFGSIEWNEIGRGLAVLAGSLTAITISLKLMPNNMVSTGVGLIAVSTALVILAQAMKSFGSIEWDEVGRGLAVLAGSLISIAGALRLMPKNMVSTGVGLIAVSTALVILAQAMKSFSGMEWDEIGRGLTVLGVSMGILAGGLKVMTGTLSGSAALVVATSALVLLIPVLSILGAMKFSSIVKGLSAIAGAFGVIGVAGLLLGPIVPSILGLSAALTLVGVGMVGIGAGLLLAGTGLTSLSVGFASLATSGAAGALSIVASLNIILTGIIGLIPSIIVAIGEGLIDVLKVITAAAPEIGDTFKAVILTLIDVMVEVVPPLVDGILTTLASLLDAIVTYTPQIVDSIFEFIIKILEGIAKNLPELIKVAIDVLMAFFAGIGQALKGIDITVLLEGIVGIGLLSAIMLALSAVAALVPGAMAGVLGMGLVVAELAIVIAAIGLLAQLPGLEWLINEGGEFLEAVGVAIGSFVGGIVGGLMGGITSQFPEIAEDLSLFMDNIQPFIEGAKNIDASTMDGVKSLAQVVLLLTAANVLDGLTSWFTGGSSLSEFGEELAKFGPHFNKYYESVKNIDGEVITASSNAAKALGEMAKYLPKSGGVIGWFTGESSLSVFADELAIFGPKLKSYSDSVKGLDSEVVINSANAAEALAQMAGILPKKGGVVGWFTGESSLTTFADELAEFGPVLKRYADSVKGLDADVIINSANSAEALAMMADLLPNQGGAVSWFTGDNTLSVFADELAIFGPKLKEYADSVKGLNSSVVINSANAAEALSELATGLPNKGGIVSWFTGDNSLSVFGKEIAKFGPHLKEYADSVSGLNTNVVSNSANAAMALSELSNNLPKSGGILSWFSGDNDLAAFGKKLVSFGESLSKYYESIKGVNTSRLRAVGDEFGRLVDLARGIAQIDVSKLGTFGKNITALGKAGINEYIKAFTDAEDRITKTARDMLGIFIDGVASKRTDLINKFDEIVEELITSLDSKVSEFREIGSDIIDRMVNGMMSQDDNSRKSTLSIIDGVLSVISNKKIAFTNAGNSVMIRFINGMNSKKTKVTESSENLIGVVLNSITSKYQDFRNNAIRCIDMFIKGVESKTTASKNAVGKLAKEASVAIRGYYSSFSSAGGHLVNGFASGISSNTYKAAAKAKEMAAAAARAARNELDMHSPSRVFYGIGDNAGLGFVNALGDYWDKAHDAGSGMAESAKSGLSKAIDSIIDIIDNDMNTTPTIKPVLDLSNVTSGMGHIDAMFSTNRAMSINSKMSKVEDSTNQNGISNNPETPISNTFIQNNYSPKALSRIDIYRQTKNQFSAMERMV